jgi:acyl dehydratase
MSNEQERLIADMIAAGFSESTAREVTEKTWPTYELVGELPDDEFVYLVTSPELATLVACSICADTNPFHSGEDAISQTLIYIANCATPTNQQTKGYALNKIEPSVEFRTAVPAGATVAMWIKVLERNPRRVTMEIYGCLNKNGKEVFTPRTLTLYCCTK